MSLNNSPAAPFRPLLIPFGLLAVSLLLRVLLGSEGIEHYYSRGIFPVFRTIWDYSLSLSPVPLFYLFWVLIVWLAWRGGRNILALRGKRARFRAGLVRLLAFTAWFVTVFLWIWGFNYGRTPVEERIGFGPYSMSIGELRARVLAEADTLAALRRQISPGDTTALAAELFPDELEDVIRPLVAAALVRQRYPAPGRPRGRQLLPKGILLRNSTAGVYWPWVAECHLDAGLHHLQKPAVMAHELAHAYGFGEEGSCTFWGWLAGQETTDPPLAYAFRLAYWRSIAGNYREADPEAYRTFVRERLDRGIVNDLLAIYANNDRYPDLFPRVRDAAYDTYLKAQGVEDGMLSYGRVVQLVEGYRRR